METASRAVCAARASTPGVNTEGELVNPKWQAKKVKAKLRELHKIRRFETDEEHEKWKEAVSAVKEEQRQVDEHRMAFGSTFLDSTGKWQLVRQSTPASMFQEVLTHPQRARPQ